MCNNLKVQSLKLNKNKIILPILIELTIFTFMNIFELFLLSITLGMEAVAAVGLCTEILTFGGGIFVASGISVATTSLLSRLDESQWRLRKTDIIIAGITISSIISVAITAIVFAFGKQLLMILGADAKVLSFALLYLKTASVGFCMYLIATEIGAVFRGLGDAVTPRNITTTAVCIKLLIDIIVIKSNLDITPAILFIGLATTIAQVCNLSALMYKLTEVLSLKPYILNFKNFFKISGELTLLAMPSATEEIIFRIFNIVYVFLIAKGGMENYSANQIATTLESTAQIPAIAVSMGATFLIGSKISEGRTADAKIKTTQCMFYSIFIMSCLSILFLVAPYFAHVLIGGRSAGEIYVIAAELLVIAAATEPLKAISYTLTGALHGAGDTLTPMVVTAINCFGVGLPIAFFTIHTLGYNIKVLWALNIFRWTIDAILMTIGYKKRFKNL